MTSAEGTVGVMFESVNEEERRKKSMFSADSDHCSLCHFGSHCERSGNVYTVTTARKMARSNSVAPIISTRVQKAV